MIVVGISTQILFNLYDYISTIFSTYVGFALSYTFRIESMTNVGPNPGYYISIHTRIYENQSKMNELRYIVHWVQLFMLSSYTGTSYFKALQLIRTSFIQFSNSLDAELFCHATKCLDDVNHEKCLRARRGFSILLLFHFTTRIRRCMQLSGHGASERASRSIDLRLHKI